MTNKTTSPLPTPTPDREKFYAWLIACPLPVLKVDDFANGYTEVHVRVTDENEDGE